ncbi:MAG: DAK2 domain-containing protein, partial [Bacteroidales bacterium]
MKQLTIGDFKKMFNQAYTDIKQREDEFSQLDAVIGDGDHGTAIVQAMQSAVEAIDKGAEFKQ